MKYDMKIHFPTQKEERLGEPANEVGTNEIECWTNDIKEVPRRLQWTPGIKFGRVKSFIHLFNEENVENLIYVNQFPRYAIILRLIEAILDTNQWYC